MGDKNKMRLSKAIKRIWASTKACWWDVTQWCVSKWKWLAEKL